MKGHVQSPVELAVRDELTWVVQSRPGRPGESGVSMRTESKRKTVGAWWVTGWESRRMLKELESASRGLEWPHLSSTLKVWRPAQNWEVSEYVAGWGRRSYHTPQRCRLRLSLLLR